MIKVLMPADKRPELSNLTYYLYVQPKYKGIRTLYFPEARKFEFIDALPSDFNKNAAESILQALKPIEDRVLDGILVKTDKGYKYYVFDSVFVREWEYEKCSEIYEERLKKTRELIQSDVSRYDIIIDAASDVAEYPFQVKNLYSKYLTNKYSGIILRSADGLYRWGKSTSKSGEMFKLEPDKKR